MIVWVWLFVGMLLWMRISIWFVSGMSLLCCKWWFKMGVWRFFWVFIFKIIWIKVLCWIKVCYLFS